MNGAQVSLEYGELRALVRELGVMTPVVRRELRTGFREVGRGAADAAKADASWSSRIPKAISVRPLTGARTAGVYLRVNSARAPHARPYEGIGGQATFRHPVFGRNRWVAEATRPYLTPAVQHARPDAEKAAKDAVLAAARVGRFT